MKPARGLVAAGVAVAILAGCSTGSEVRTDGPLVGAEGATRVCVPSDPSVAVTFGSTLLYNNGSQRLTIDGMRLLDARNVTLVGGYLVPVEGTNLLGDGAPFPPSRPYVAIAGLAWDRRTTLAGASLSPGGEFAKAGSAAPMNLVIGLVSRTPAGGAAKGVQLSYHVGGQKYLATSTMGMAIRLRPDTCSDGGH